MALKAPSVAAGLFLAALAVSGRFGSEAATKAANNGTRLLLQGISEPVAAKVGSDVTLYCKANAPWKLCGWRRPDGAWCDRLWGASQYTTHCHGNARIQYPVEGFSGGASCQIKIVNLSVEDNGPWLCQLKDQVRGDEWVESEVTVRVAVPYKLELQVPEELEYNVTTKTLSKVDASSSSNGTTTDSPIVATCKASSPYPAFDGVDLELFWVINGIRVVEPSGSSLTSVVQTVAKGKGSMHQMTLPLQDYSGDLRRAMDGESLTVRCLSVQRHPDGSVLFENTAVKRVTVTFSGMNKPRNQRLSQNNGPGKTAGLVIAIMISIGVVTALILVCVGQRKKVWCFASGPGKTKADENLEGVKPRCQFIGQCQGNVSDNVYSSLTDRCDPKDQLVSSGCSENMRSKETPSDNDTLFTEQLLGDDGIEDVGVPRGFLTMKTFAV